MTATSLERLRLRLRLQPGPAVARRLRPVALVLLLALLAGLAWLVLHQPQRSWDAAAQYALTLDGGHYRVDARQLDWLRQFSALRFAEGEEAARALAAAEVSARLDEAFAGVAARLPEFADWYYSLSGEYARLSMLALSWLSLADEGFVAQRASALLFPEEIWDADLQALEARTAARLSAHHQQVRASWLAELTARLSQQRVPAPLMSDPAGLSESLRLDALVTLILERERAAMTARASLSTVAAGGVVAGPALWRAASARAASGGGRPALARAAGRGAARAGSAAAGGAVVCAPGGPAALGCAVVAGAAAWLAADWALLRLDEAINREHMIAALEASLAQLRLDMERDLLTAYDAMIASQYQSVQQDIRTGFVPLRAR